MDLLKKLDECEKRFKEVNDLVMDPNLVKDPKKYKDTMREHGYLSELCELSKKYKNVLQGIQDAKEMIIDSIRFTKQKQVIILDIIKSYYSNQKYLLIMQKTPNKRFYFLIFVI